MTAKTSASTVCVLCREELRPGSSYCPQCKSHQGFFRRNAGVAGAFISGVGAIIAAISSTGTLYLFHKTQFAPREDKIEFHVVGQVVQGKGASGLTVLATNLGNSPGAISAARMDVPFELVETLGGPSIEFELPENLIVSAGETRQIALVRKGTAIPRPAGKYDRQVKCVVEIQLLHFDGKPEKVELIYLAAGR